MIFLIVVAVMVILTRLEDIDGASRSQMLYENDNFGAIDIESVDSGDDGDDDDVDEVVVDYECDANHSRDSNRSKHNSNLHNQSSSSKVIPSKHHWVMDNCG